MINPSPAFRAIQWLALLSHYSSALGLILYELDLQTISTNNVRESIISGLGALDTKKLGVILDSEAFCHLKMTI